MPFLSINPATGEEFFRAEGHRPAQVESILEDAASAAPAWRTVPVAERSAPAVRRREGLRSWSRVVAPRHPRVRECQDPLGRLS